MATTGRAPKDTAPAADTAERYSAAWKSLSRSRRATLASAVARGHKATERSEAALMLWWGARELERGAKPGLKIAGLMIAAIFVAQFVVSGLRFDDFASVLSPLPLFLAIPFASWYFRRPKVQMSMRRNAGHLAGRTFDDVPTQAEIDKLLRKAKLDV